MFDEGKIRWLAALLTASVLGCGDGVLAEGGGDVYFTPWNADQVQPTVIEDRQPVLPPEQSDNYEEVVRGFSAQAPDLLQRPDVVDVLGPIEQSFLLSGKYLDLVDIYREHYEQHGVGSVAAPALAWTYMQLGNAPALAELKEEMLEHRADDPLTWVIVGNIHMRQADASMESARRAKEAFERVLELDPQFGGFKATEPAALRQQLDALRRRVPDEPAEETDVDAVAAAPMHHVEEGDEPTPIVDASEAAEPAEEEEDIYGGDADEPAGEIAEEQVEEQVDPDGEIDEEDTAEDEDVTEAQAAHYVVRGQQAFQRGSDHYPEAQDHFRRALDLDSDNVDAGIGLLRIAARTGAPDEMLYEQVDRFVDRELSAQQAYDLGLFCLRRLNDRDRATSLLQRVQQKDPSFARRVGVDSLLD